MWYKFPKSFFDYPQPGVGLITSGKSVLAYYRIVDEIKRAQGFLTEHTLIFVFKGSKNIHFPDAEVQAGAGQLLMLKRGAYFMSTFLGEEEGYEAMMLCMDDQFLKSFLKEYTNVDAVTTSQAHTTLLLTCSSEVAAVRDGMLHYMNHQNDHSGNLIQLKLEELFLLLLAGPHKEKVMQFLLHLFDTSATAIEMTVRANLFKPFTLNDYARLCGLSLSSFKREFAAIFQTSPREWINDQRLQHANFLLQTTDQNVNEIADACGFENVSYFIKVYKGKYGLTPKNAARPKIATF